ncbi:MAG: hypothetical protein A2W04_00045 [Betaproteobacteria bacterium RBG_16_64_9]|nr:MAG: hypothetical protein A2W04_00045 [Betaproteobacteria bacterium RBG_16_64_9]OGA32931.1 MAG: hypothetical protein A3G80_15855 [Betaproteobacteria bacterium RIFCSPLOWO2_12_FULL_62_13b]
MEKIVRKLAAGAATSERPQPGAAMEIRIQVNAESLGKMKKRVVVKGMRADSSTWEMLCDEGERVGGEDSAPPPLVYFSAGIAF